MEALIQKLRAWGIAVTPQRLAILAVLEKSRDHPSAEQIYQEVRQQLPMVSFNTVYKTLEVFCQKGLALKVNPLHEMARYDGDTREHAHFICRGCHRIIDVAWHPAPLPPLPPGELQGLTIEHQYLLLWGLCPRCQKPLPPKEE